MAPRFVPPTPSVPTLDQKTLRLILGRIQTALEPGGLGLTPDELRSCGLTDELLEELNDFAGTVEQFAAAV